MGTIKFTKMHGIGNDYVYINCMHGSPVDPARLSVVMSPRHTSVGSDGIILILPSETADFRMRIFNADGSEASMCGNGSRCVGKYVYDHALTDKTNITLETNSGVKYLELHVDPLTNKVTTVTVNMGKPTFVCAEIPVHSASPQMIEQPVESNGKTWQLTAVSMGNPHGVIFTDCIDNLNLKAEGEPLENHPMWPDRANIEFVEVLSPNHVRMRVWERGSGETMACGTGACAVAMAAMKTGRCPGNEVTVTLLGGDLQISKNERGEVMMTGPAEEAFNGTFEADFEPDLG